jgi:transcriptional regulator with XRE-family HTH domain
VMDLSQSINTAAEIVRTLRAKCVTQEESARRVGVARETLSRFTLRLRRRSGSYSYGKAERISLTACSVL